MQSFKEILDKELKKLQPKLIREPYKDHEIINKVLPHKLNTTILNQYQAKKSYEN